MNINTPQAAAQQAAPQDELILVVKREVIIPEQQAWQGLKKEGLESIVDSIEQKKEFLPRSLMETDPRYKQVIPYLIFNYEDKYFLMQRQAKATETRLQSKFSMGIGGHIRQEDVEGKNIIDWAKREFEEEVHYLDGYTIEPMGILNDDSNAVGEVHIGLVLLLRGNSQNISVKSELKSGVLLTLEECKAFYDRMESWTQIVFDALIK